VLAALAGSEVPHPALIAACGNEEVLGVAFYLMEPVNGFNPTSGLPALHARDPAIRHRMGLALVEGAVAIAQVDIEAVGLAKFGKTENFLERQAGRWQKQLDNYGKFENWPGPDGLPGISEIPDFLSERCPATFRPGLMHGDYTLTNVMYRPDNGELAAIIDWELCTVGDPLIDLGWLLATWNGVPPIDLNILQVEPWSGFPGADEMLAHYAERSGASVENIDWYFVLACYKLGIILEGTFARACAGRDPLETGRMLHEAARRLMLRALHRIS
jgi:aminoglycoside phosphotransferase (APT) family kinase protein